MPSLFSESFLLKRNNPMSRRFSIVLSLLVLACAPLLHADELDNLARDFWAWRAAEMPVSNDDIPRLERPADWVPDWSPESVVRYQRELEGFEARWKKIDSSTWPISRQVDYRLIGSAIARVRWELDKTQAWKRNPLFYKDQTIGAYFSLLLPPPPFDAARSHAIIRTLASFPRMLDDAKANLNQPVAPFARLAINLLKDVRPALSQSVHDLKPLLDQSSSSEIDKTTEKAISSLESYRAWLAQRLPGMVADTAVGRDAYMFFLKQVALLPYTPEQLLEIGRQEWARAVSFQTYEEHRNAGLPELPIFKTSQEQIDREQADEIAVRRYLEEKNILSVPPSMQHYLQRPMPAYLGPLLDLDAGEADYFTSADRLNENGIRYIPAPSPEAGYFAVADAKEPRTGIVHEGVPGHYFQLALSWGHPDFIRRHYYGSSANEGIGFYAEEMMQEAGLFDNSPRSREIIDNFMRLRALRVEVDVKLALGKFNIEQAAAYLHATVPMDSATALDEASAFASAPGQAISYQIGKAQIMNLLADAHRKQGKNFNLRAFHDYVWLNGNVPIVLQRWEYLGLRDDLDQVDAPIEKSR
jgi:uncharacterized protein (DUF885 family)